MVQFPEYSTVPYPDEIMTYSVEEGDSLTLPCGSVTSVPEYQGGDIHQWETTRSLEETYISDLVSHHERVNIDGFGKWCYSLHTLLPLHAYIM